MEAINPYRRPFISQDPWTDAYLVPFFSLSVIHIPVGVLELPFLILELDSFHTCTG